MKVSFLLGQCVECMLGFWQVFLSPQPNSVLEHQYVRLTSPFVYVLTALKD